MIVAETHVCRPSHSQATRFAPYFQHQCADAQAELVVLGGACFVNGNVNPAAEANIFGDPDAADIVFGGAVFLAMRSSYHQYTAPR